MEIFVTFEELDQRMDWLLKRPDSLPQRQYSLPHGIIYEQEERFITSDAKFVLFVEKFVTSEKKNRHCTGRIRYIIDKICYLYSRNL